MSETESNFIILLVALAALLGPGIIERLAGG